MKILAIETSCDDTAIAILEAKNGKFTALSNIVSSQHIHQNYGGVFPILAKREHQTNLVPVLTQALQKAKLLKIRNSKSQSIDDRQLLEIKKILEKESGLYEFTKKFLETYEKPKVDYIAVTCGPGLEPCLWVGVNFAKALSYFWDISVIPVNHIEGHILVNFLENNLYYKKESFPKRSIRFPAISLVVSGGHTQLILVKGIGKYDIIGETRDDAAGECFDKAARILGLGYPGGPIISKIAADYRGPTPVKLPRPMMHTKDYDFSFSGLKTAVLYETKGKQLTKKYISQMCFAVQDAICDVLIKKTLNAAKDYKAKTIILGGGVSANSELRSQFEFKNKNAKIKIIYPPKELSTDNALMIAVAAYFRLKQPHFAKASRVKEKIAWQKLSVHANLRVG